MRKEKEMEERKRQADYDRLPPILKGLTVIVRLTVRRAGCIEWARRR